MMWILEGSFLDGAELNSHSFPHVQISGPSLLVIEKILDTCLNSMSDRNINLLGRILDNIDLRISAIFASKLQSGKFSVVDFFLKDDSSIELADTMKLCDYIGVKFVENWILPDGEKKSESLKILLCYGQASNRHYMTISNPFNLKSEAFFFKTFDAYYDPILEVGHQFKFVINSKAIEQEFKEDKPVEESNDATSIWIEWNGTRKTLNYYGQDFYEDDLLLFRRIFILSIRKICLKTNLKIRKYIKVIRIITTAPGQFSMKWEIDQSRATGKENVFRRLKQCMLDFVETCGAIPKNDPTSFVNLEDYGGIAIESTNFSDDIRNSELILDKANKISIYVLQNTIEECSSLPFKTTKTKANAILGEVPDSCEDEYSVSVKEVNEFEKIHQSMKESENDVKFAQSILASVMIKSLELLLSEFKKGDFSSVNSWTFSLCYDHNFSNASLRDLKTDQARLVQLMYRNKPLWISRAEQLEKWTETLWLLTNDQNVRDKQISIVFTRFKIKNRLEDEHLCSSIDLAEALVSWQRILFLILAEGPSLGAHVNSVKMQKEESRAVICLFYQKGQGFIGREVVHRAWRYPQDHMIK